LHRYSAIGKAWQLGDRARGLHQQAVGREGAERPRLQAGGLQLRQVIGQRLALPVAAQRKRRRQLRGGQQGLPTVRPILLQAPHPPGWVLVLRLRGLKGGGQQRIALAQKATQHRIDHGGLRWQRLACRLHRLVDEGVLGVIGRLGQ
jgi:hypothetical protein